jgi:DNA-binding response OmpR family regulator
VNVLVVEDERVVRELVQTVLAEAGHTCHLAADADEAARALAPGHRFDLILLDVVMPHGSGWEVLERVRLAGDATPAIFVSGCGEVADRVRGLRLGADDYIVKPFAAEELLARIEAVGRRHREPPVLNCGDLRLDLTRRLVERGGRRVELTPQESQLLRVLLESPGEAISRTRLLERVWGMDFDPGTTLVEVQIARLRRKLDRLGPPMIETVVGQGYRIRVAAPEGGAATR